MHALLLTCVALLASACVDQHEQHGQIVIAATGMPGAQIRWWSRSDARAPEFAALELQRYIAAICGTVLEVARLDAPASPAPEGVIMVPGLLGVAAAVQAKSQAYDLAGDGYAIDSRGDSIVIASLEPRGVLFGAYALLRELGVRFFAPDFPFYRGQGEFVPRSDTVALQRGFTLTRPDFAIRRKYIAEGTSHSASTVRALLDWMAKNRLNTLVYSANQDAANFVRWDEWRDSLAPELARRGLLLEVGGHGYQSFLSRAQYEAQYPDWFGGAAEPIAGPGKPPANVFRVSNNAALARYAASVSEYLLARPEISVFDAWPPDGAKWIASDVSGLGGIPNAMERVTCAVGAVIEANSVSVSVESLGYISTFDPPSSLACLSTHSLFDVAPYDRSYATWIGDAGAPANRRYAGVFQEWRDAGFSGTLGVYEYYRKYSWHSLPVILPEQMGQDFAYYFANGVRAVGFQSEPADWITYELAHLLGAALAWDAATDTRQFVRDYLESRYGAAAPAMAEYFIHVAIAGQTLFDGPQGRYGDSRALAEASRQYSLAKKALEAALPAVAADRSELVRLLLANVAYSINDTDLGSATLFGQHDRAAALAASLASEIELYKFDGIILKNFYSIRRYDPAITYADTYGMYDVYRQAFQ